MEGLGSLPPQRKCLVASGLVSCGRCWGRARPIEGCRRCHSPTPHSLTHAGRGRPGFQRVPGLSFSVRVREEGAWAPQNSAHTPQSPLARTFQVYSFLPREEATEKNSQTAKPRRSRWDPAPVVQIRKLRHGEAEGRSAGAPARPVAPPAAPSPVRRVLCLSRSP